MRLCRASLLSSNTSPVSSVTNTVQNGSTLTNTNAGTDMFVGPAIRCRRQFWRVSKLLARCEQSCNGIELFADTCQPRSDGRTDRLRHVCSIFFHDLGNHDDHEDGSDHLGLRAGRRRPRMDVPEPATGHIAAHRSCRDWRPPAPPRQTGRQMGYLRES